MNKDLKDLLLKTDLSKVMANKNYNYFTQGDYNLNIIGIRNLLQGNTQDNTFNDAIVVTYKTQKGWTKLIYDATTDPGSSVMLKPSNPKGIAILVPNQYKSSFTIGLHKAKYQCLVQCKPVKVYRDNNKNTTMDFNPSTIEEGMFGIHIHKAGITSNYVNNWSEGCNVFKIEQDFNQFMTLVKKASSLYGDKFTYTLLTTKDLI